MPVRITEAPAGTVTLTLRAGARTIARGTVTIGAGGTGGVVLRATRAGARRLRAGGRATLTVAEGTARVVKVIRLT